MRFNKSIISVLCLYFLFCSFGLLNAQRTIQGTVRSAATDEALPGATVAVLNSTTGTVTDADGNYTILVSNDDTVLIYSYIGFVNQQIPVGTQTVINVLLQEQAELIDEVIVIAYGETERRKFTGSLTTVSADDISKVPQASPIQMLQGKAAGVLVEDINGQPGTTGSIVIRGIGTLGTATDPLYVIDGTPTTSLASLNPSDIESISILKDAIATSIYGSRAANGVVLISTKKGAIGKTRFSLNASYGFSDIENPNDFRMMNSAEYVEYYREAFTAMGKDPDDPTGGSYLPVSAANTNTDWLDEVTRAGTAFQLELTASGGSERSRHFASISHYSQEGAVLGTKYDRTTGRLNFGMSPVNKVNVDINLLGSYTQSDLQYSDDGRGGTFSGAFNVAPTAVILATDETPAHLNGLGYNFDLPSNAGHNPVATANIRERGLSGLRVFPSLKISFEPVSKLVLSSSASIDYTFNEEDAYQSKFYFAETDNGLAEHETMVFTDANFNVTAAYEYDISADHQISPLIGIEFYESTTKIEGTASRDFAFDGINNVAAGAVPLGNSYVYNANTLVSLFGRLSYAFRNKLFVEGSFRRDGSSRFSPDNRWGNFYAFGVGYNLMGESFMESQSLFSALRLRASYGIQGNNGVGDFAWRSGYGPGGTFIVPPDGGGSGAANSGSQPDEPGNPDLKWEQSKLFNVGIDFGILDNRVGGTIEYYNRTSVDLLAERLISHTSGFTSIIDNIGNVENRGIEISLYSTNVQTGDFTWDTDFNISFNTNEIVELNGVSDTLFADERLVRILGEPLDQWYLPQYAGVDPATGLPTYLTSDGGVSSNINNAVTRLSGNSSLTPDFFGSLTNTLSYKGLSLSFMFYIKQGFEVYRSHLSDLSVPSSNNQPASNLARWQSQGDQTNVPRSDDTNAQLNSTRWLEDGSFIRLRNLSLAYSLPAAASSEIGLSGLTFSLRGVNVLTFTDYTGFNPDVGYYEDDDYPIPRTITFGISAQF